MLRQDELYVRKDKRMVRIAPVDDFLRWLKSALTRDDSARAVVGVSRELEKALEAMVTGHRRVHVTKVLSGKYHIMYGTKVCELVVLVDGRISVQRTQGGHGLLYCGVSPKQAVATVSFELLLDITPFDR